MTYIFEPMVLIVGMCLGAVIATIAYTIASYVDYRRNKKLIIEKLYDNFDWDEILFKDYSWYDIPYSEIVLPEI